MFCTLWVCFWWIYVGHVIQEVLCKRLLSEWWTKLWTLKWNWQFNLNFNWNCYVERLKRLEIHFELNSHQFQDNIDEQKGRCIGGTYIKHSETDHIYFEPNDQRRQKTVYNNVKHKRSIGNFGKVPLIIAETGLHSNKGLWYMYSGITRVSCVMKICTRKLLFLTSTHDHCKQAENHKRSESANKEF